MTLWKTAAFTPEYAGWIPPDERTAAMKKVDKQFVDETPTVTEAFGSGSGTSTRPRIWQVVGEAIKQGLVPQEWVREGANGNKHLKNISQIIGSCVGFGAGNMALYASVIDAMIRKQPEKIMVPFVPYHYGRGRLHSGIRGSGSGSFGSGQAKALKIDGMLAFDHAGVPKMGTGDALMWTAQIETQWSDGARIGEEFVKAGQRNTFPTQARVTTLDEAANLLDSYYVFTAASNWGGLMKCPIVDGVLLNRKSGRWMHQMSVLDYIVHPRLGRLWYWDNQWRYPHGIDPGGEWDGGYGAPPGGFYMDDENMDYVLRQKEVIGFTNPEGFEDRSRKFKWITAA